MPKIKICRKCPQSPENKRFVRSPSSIFLSRGWCDLRQCRRERDKCDSANHPTAFRRWKEIGVSCLLESLKPSDFTQIQRSQAWLTLQAFVLEMNGFTARGFPDPSRGLETLPLSLRSGSTIVGARPAASPRPAQSPIGTLCFTTLKTLSGSSLRSASTQSGGELSSPGTVMRRSGQAPSS